MELWDIYDRNRNPKGRTHVRGIPLAKDDYHIAVYIWIINSTGCILLTKRHPNKDWPNMWECTGGSVISGEDSAIGAIREVEEEIGISLDNSKGRIIHNFISEDTICDVWLFLTDIDLNHVNLQAGEVSEIMYVTKKILHEMFRNKQMAPRLDYILQLLERDKELRELVK